MLTPTLATDTPKKVTMNKTSSIVKQYWSVLLVMIICLLYATPHATAAGISNADLERKVHTLPSIVDVRYTSTVQKHIRNYTVYNKKGTEAILGRASLYFTMFENVLADKGLPQDLKYLAIVESGLKPSATSRVGAAGMWQFMRSTGRMMGLKVNSTIDDRRDPVKSTEAAADYLQYLHEKFGDWTLALAAYNCGPGNVRKAIRRSGGKRTFWEIKDFLPKETRNYIPKFIAVSYVMNYYYEHDLIPAIQSKDMTDIATAQVYEKVSLYKLSKSLMLDLTTVKRLNPSYLKNYIPASSDGSYQLTLPREKMYDFVNGSNTAMLMSSAYAVPTRVAENVTQQSAPTKRSSISIEAILTKATIVDKYLSTMGGTTREQMRPRLEPFERIKMKWPVLSTFDGK